MSKHEQLEEKVRQLTLENAKLRSQLADWTQRAVAPEDALHQGKKLSTQAQSQIVQSEKMASLGTLVVGVAHELNNPANFTYTGAINLQNYLEDLRIFLDELSEDSRDISEMFTQKFEPIFRNLKIILDGTERIRQIATELKTFSRQDDEQKRVNPFDGLLSTLTLVQASYKDNVEFVTELHDEPDLWCWPAQLNQVFMNLILNACQSISARQQREPAHKGRLQIKSSEVNHWLVVCFTDNGSGMSEEVMTRIFEPFYSTRVEGGGTGLGLSISSSIIERHRGKLTVSSKEGEGTTFELHLPMMRRSFEEESSPSHKPA